MTLMLVGIPVVTQGDATLCGVRDRKAIHSVAPGAFALARPEANDRHHAGNPVRCL
jgi:hypothetical protein